MRCGALFIVALGVALGACSFQATPVASQSDPGAPIDAAAPVPDATAVAPAPPSAYCDPTSGTAAGHVFACYEFEGSAGDGSSTKLTTTTADLSFMPGQVGQAVGFTTDSAIDIAESPVFDAGSLTMEMWINPSQLPSGEVDTVYLLDVNNQYAFQLKEDGSLHCTLIDGKSLDGSANIKTNHWTHIACTYDQTSGMSVLYANGSQLNSDNGTKGKPLSNRGSTGMSLGADNAPEDPAQRSRVTGMLDQVRLLNVARTKQEICDDSGVATCQ
jgi:hypothetical protein